MVGIAGFVSALQWNSWCFMDSSRFFDVAQTLHTMFKNTVLLAFAKYLNCILSVITIYKDSDISVEYCIVQRDALSVLLYDEYRGCSAKFRYYVQGICYITIRIFELHPTIVTIYKDSDIKTRYAT